MTFWSLTNSDFPTNQTFQQFYDIYTELDLHRLWVVSMEHLQRVWHASRDTYPSGHLVPSPIVGLACAPLLRPDSSNLPCLYSTFHLEYPLVLSRFCFSNIYVPSVFCYDEHKKIFDIHFSMKKHTWRITVLAGCSGGCSEANEKYRGVFEIQRSGDKTSSGEIGLDIRTHASPKVGQDQVSGGVSVLCWHAAPVAYVLWKPCTIR